MQLINKSSMGSNRELKLEIIYKPIGSILGYVNNTRVHPQDQIDQIKSSISEFGMCTPIGIHNNIIVYGHGRHEALKQLGYEEIPTLDLSHLTDAQRKAFIIADNKIGDNSEFDLDLLKVEIEALHEMDFNIDLLGFSMEELEDLDINFGEPDMPLDESKADDVPELVENPVIKLGDLIELGHNYQHRLLCGDSTSEDDVKRLMDGKKADMVFTDPPYNVDYGNSNNPNHKSRTIKNDTMTDENWNIFVNGYMKQLLENCNGNIYISMSDKELGHMQETFKKHGGKWASFIIWVKDQLVLSGKDYHSKHETILYGWNAKMSNRQRVENRKETDVWEIPRPKVSDLHPTMKPVELVERAIYNSSKTHNVILDLFGGSGTTMIASENVTRMARLMELDEKYAQVIIQRYVDYTSNPMIKINGREVDWNIYKDENS